MKGVKVVFFTLVFLMLVGGVLAMDDPIRVRARAGEEVRVFIWPAEYGPAINSDKGMTDENGFFTSKMFFSLSSDNFTVQVGIFDSEGDKIGNGDFGGMNSLSPIFVDCRSRDCVLSSWEVEGEEIETVVEDVAVESSGNDSGEPNETVENETVVDVVVEEKVSEDGEVDFTGKVIVDNENSSVYLTYSIGGFVLFLFLITFIFTVLRHGKVKKVDVLDGDEKELKYMEKRVKEIGDEIKDVKEKKDRHERLEEAKRKLTEEEAELKELQVGENDERIEKQEDVVDRAEDRIKDVRKD